MVSNRFRICLKRGKSTRRLPTALDGGYIENGGGPPAVSFSVLDRFWSGSAQQLQHALLRLVGERQRGHRDRLARRQRLAVGRFLVGIGQRQIGGAGLQHVDQVLVEVLTELHDRQVRTQGRRLGTERGAGRAEYGERLVRRVVVQEVRAHGQRRQAQAAGAVGDAGDAERGLCGFVEGQLEVVTIQQVDAVEGRILSGRRDLRDDVVVLADQAGTRGLRDWIGSWRAAANECKRSRTTQCNRVCSLGRGECERLAGLGV